MWLIYIAIEPAKTWRVQYEYLLKMILVIYIPGSQSLPQLAQRAMVLINHRHVCFVHAHDGSTEKDDEGEAAGTKLLEIFGFYCHRNQPYVSSTYFLITLIIDSR